ncbi:hypothetical protein JCM11251_005065 [Rhodosporidiobolus azoricus]
MAPITLAASQELAAATPLVNEERNPRPPTLYMSCTVSAKDAQVALANEERNPRPPTLYMLPFPFFTCFDVPSRPLPPPIPVAGVGAALSAANSLSSAAV